MKPILLPPRGSSTWHTAALLVFCSALQPPPVASAADVRSVAGVWDSSFGAVTLEQGAPSPASTLAVRGYHDESPGRRAEIRDGKFDPTTGALEFTYFQPWRNLTGTGRFTLSADGAKLNGTFNQSGSSGAWILTRRGDSAAPAAAAPAAAVTATIRSVAGRWNSKLGPVTLQHAVPTGASSVVVAGFHDESRDHRAELRDGTFDPATGLLVFTYFQAWRNVTGTGRFVLSADGQTLTGTYSQPGASGPWNLERAPEAAVASSTAPRTQGGSSEGAGTQLAVALVGALFGPKEHPPAAAQPAASPPPATTPGLATVLTGALFGGAPPSAAPVSAAPAPSIPSPAGNAGATTEVMLRGGLVGEWLFAGDTADSSGRGFNGKISGGATPASDRFDWPGMALRFNGTNAKLDCGPLPGVNLTQQATLSLWVKLEGRPGYWHIAGKAGNGTDLDLIVDGGVVRFYIAGGANYSSRRKLAEGEWAHVAASFRAGGKLKVYLNGELDGAIDIGARGENGNPFTLGESGAWGGRWFKGILDEVRLYDRQLTDAEILALSRERSTAGAPSTAAQAALNYFERGKSLLAAGDYRDAVEAFTKALEQNPRHADAYRERARTHNRLQDYRAGLADAERAIALNPNDAVAVNLRGNARGRLGDAAGAMADYSKSIQLDPKYAAPLANRGALRLAAKEYGAARQDYDRALAIAPRDENALWGRADVKAKTGDLPGALADYDQALALNPRNAGILNNRGQALYQNGRYAEAMESFNQALAINPRYANALANRGATRARLGDAPGGQADLEEALMLDPANTFAQGALAAVRNPRSETTRATPVAAVAPVPSQSGRTLAEIRPPAQPVAAGPPPVTGAPPTLPARTSGAAAARPPAPANRFLEVDQSSLTAPLRAALLASPALAVREQRGAILFRPSGDLHVVSECPAPGGSRKLEILADGERRAVADASVQKTSMRLLAVVDPAGKGIEVTSAAAAGPEDDELIRLLEARR